MATKKTNRNLASLTDRIAKLNILYIIAFSVSIVVYHATNLVPPESILDRWILAAAMMIVSVAVWAINRSFSNNSMVSGAGIWTLIIANLMFAGFIVYFERGMASLAVALFIVPLAIASSLKSKVPLYATAALASTIYGLVSVKYFVDFFNEGYKAQLYSTIGFYAAVFFIVAAILVAIQKDK